MLPDRNGGGHYSTYVHINWHLRQMLLKDCEEKYIENYLIYPLPVQDILLQEDWLLPLNAIQYNKDHEDVTQIFAFSIMTFFVGLGIYFPSLLMFCEARSTRN